MVKPKRDSYSFSGALVMAAVAALLLGCSSNEIIGFQDKETEVPDAGQVEEEEEEECNYPTMYVEGEHLYDICGDKFIPIGVNEMLVWAPDKDGSLVFPEIKKTGANAVRFAWTTDEHVGELEEAIENCIDNRMVAIPEINNEDRSFETVPGIVAWWVAPEMIEIIKKHERFLIVDVANGRGDKSVTESEFVDTYREAVETMRAAGIRVPLMVGSSDYGTDIDRLQNTFSELQASDPLSNLLFGVYVWWVADDGSTDKIVRELRQSRELNMPMLVAEFAPMIKACEQYIDVETLLAECERNAFGFMAWSWGKVNNDDCEYLGMTTDGIFGNWRDTPDNGRWGELVAVTHPDSIQNRAVESRAFSVLDE